MSSNDVLTATFLAVAAGSLIWAAIGMVVRLARRNRLARDKSAMDQGQQPQ
ncbi:MAG: hypothetical protein ACRDYU_12385 [Actinomycetes bacterium]